MTAWQASGEKTEKSRNTKRSIERRVPGCTSKRLETRHSSQAVKCFRGVNFNNVASREAQQRQPVPVSELWHRCIFIPVLPPSPSAFFPVHLSEHPLYTRPASFDHYPRYNKCDWACLDIIYSVSSVFSRFSVSTWIPSAIMSALCTHNVHLLIIFRHTTEQILQTALARVSIDAAHIRLPLMSFDRLGVALFYVLCYLSNGWWSMTCAYLKDGAKF